MVLICLNKRYLCLALLCLVVLLISSCDKGYDSADNSTWMTAKELDTVDAYEAYLEDYPEGIYVVQAKNRIDYLTASAEIDKQISEAKAIAQEHEERKASEEAMVSIFAPLLGGVGIEGTADFNRSDPDLVKVFVMAKPSEFHQQAQYHFLNYSVPQRWVPLSWDEVSLVLVVIREEIIEIDSEYYSEMGLVYRTKHELAVELLEAKSGMLLGSKEFVSSEPDPFPEYLVVSGQWVFGVELDTKVDPEEVFDWLKKTAGL